MPRTKRPVKKAEKSIEGGETLKKLDKLVGDQKKKIDARAQMEVRNIELAFKILIGSISSKYLNMTVGQLKKLEAQLNEPLSTHRSRNSARSASHDDGYITENSSHGSGDRGLKKAMAPPSSSSRSVRRSRSADTGRGAAGGGPGGAAGGGPGGSSRRRSRSVLRTPSLYRTPAYNRNAPSAYPPITPKVAPQTPMTVLRQPRQGEMVVSMTGSPVMVPTYTSMQSEEQANCNIMLSDGTMLSLQPRELRKSQAFLPFSLMGPNLLDQIKTLKDNLEKVVELGEKALK